MRVREEDMEKIAFRTCYGHYDFVVMPFRLTNALGKFFDLMIRVCRPMLDRSIIVFVDYSYCIPRPGSNTSSTFEIFWEY